ncbi:MAG: ATP-binding cassette domain-containing protein [Lachnospiraceae bacterium]|nr:ATP-binding cassette domain-containing protein [Lachnospiraceae bacterium]
MENNLLLEMKQIDKQFTGVHALNHVDFSVRKGEIHALMGENGAGKSTLIKVLTGLYSKDSGQIIFDGISQFFIRSFFAFFCQLPE